VADRVDAEVRSQARGQAAVVAASAADVIAPPDEDALDRRVTRAAESVRGRVIVVDRRGRLLADSGDTRMGGSYRSRPEIAAALAGRTDQRERASATLGERLLATSVPIVRAGRPVGAVRVTQSVAAVDRAVRRAWIGLGVVGLLVVGLGLAVGWVLAEQVSRPVRRLEQAARRVGEGDLSARARVEGSAEQRALAQTFNETADRLERLLASQREFVADASHQLRTPLAGLRLRLEAARGETSDPAVHAQLDAGLTEADRLSAMVTELLELSRAGERDAPAEQIDLADAVRRAAGRWDAAAAERGQRVVIGHDAEGEAEIARADVDRILDALVENALHYSPDDTTVTLVARPGHLRVLDEGPGIPRGEEEAVFERFHRGTNGRRGPAGTGLGLPIARELARRWGGDVGLRRRDTGGTAAEVTLP
jgi:signal transduction histidine kinase